MNTSPHLTPDIMSSSIAPALRNRKRRGEGLARRAEILAAASRLLLSEGVENTTMRRIAADVGVSPTALYVYFPRKDAILQTISRETFAKLLAELETSQVRIGTVLERFEALLRTYVAFGLANPDSFRLIFLTPCSIHSAAFGDAVPDAYHSFNGLIHGVETMMQAGHFQSGPLVATAEAISACMNGLITMLLNKAAFMVTPQDELIDRVIRAVMAGF